MATERDQKVIEALTAARPHVARVAATQPTTTSRELRRRSALRALGAIDDALDALTQPVSA